MSMLVSTEELPDPTIRKVDGDSVAWDIGGGLVVLWVPPEGRTPAAVGLGIHSLVMPLPTATARDLALALLAAGEHTPPRRPTHEPKEHPVADVDLGPPKEEPDCHTCCDGGCVECDPTVHGPQLPDPPHNTIADDPW